MHELQALAVQGERREIEFKESVHDKPAARKVIRAVAAMANLRDGGLVVLGIEDKTGAIRGLSPSELSQWSDRDKALNTVNAQLDPSVDLETHQIGSCVVLEVRPFSKVPIVARTSKGEAHQPDALVEGALLYRSSVTISSSPISRLEDWIELRETLLIRAWAGAKRLEDERKRAERAADEERVREALRAARDAFIPPVVRDIKPQRGLFKILSGNFRLATIRTHQSEAKTNLKSIYTAFVAYSGETDRFPPSLETAGFKPRPGGKYVYRAVDGEIIGAEQRTDRPELVAAGLRCLARYDARPHISERTFLVMAVARIEPEGLIDVWIVDRFGDPRCLTPETTDAEARRWNERLDAMPFTLGTDAT
ncbi:putative DNA binding domain-containing protein [Myxococcus sp. QH3KD-4-1]|nr:putative DNA binding domain-containing protein [Myxococcus qinghaiensis]